MARQFSLPPHQSNYRRTVVLGDLHGDLDVMLRSLAAKNILRFDGSLGSVLTLIRQNMDAAWVPEFEAMVVPQTPRIQLILLGDLLDRYHHGYHLIQFLKHIRWRRFGIDFVCLMGNHDLHNLQFFTNPFAVFQMYKESEHLQMDVMDFIGRMGLIQSMVSFLDLHREELVTLQQQFYREGRLAFPLGTGSEAHFSYGCDLSVLARETYESWEDVWNTLGEVAAARGFSFEERGSWQQTLADFSRQLSHSLFGVDGWNVWDLLPPWLETCGNQDGYDPRLRFANAVVACDDGLQPRRFMLLDWRIIAMVWRQHYGDFFRGLSVMYLEGNTLFVHGGLSPQTLLDQFGFGVLHNLVAQQFHSSEDPRRFGLVRAVARLNRLSRQVIDNALGDVTFRSNSGSELIDGIGSRRGGRAGFTQFGGPFWADFDFVNQMTHQNDQIRGLYRAFVQAVGLRRVICGHTRFEEPGKPELRYLRLKVMRGIGLDYICVDNSCSRGYRLESVLNGIEIDELGEITDPGEMR
ncbi:metallophosphoesterase [Acanthopleuribacter pedis]|uniref:Metallophosphoesterase n=1 Tax=Acanthopleuribacter pedis TaxID=442870 RepID=A0A8J7Q5K9_9BACT|nr:metallophosphoesterase [Acanthopleuribacter pedis]MBO1317044.1 metallophosphoesterase [Acanthopleuribacter pedis]